MRGDADNAAGERAVVSFFSRLGTRGAEAFDITRSRTLVADEAAANAREAELFCMKSPGDH
jgi:hypothetical protein